MGKKMGCVRIFRLRALRVTLLPVNNKHTFHLPYLNLLENICFILINNKQVIPFYNYCFFFFDLSQFYLRWRKFVWTKRMCVRDCFIFQVWTWLGFILKNERSVFPPIYGNNSSAAMTVSHPCRDAGMSSFEFFFYSKILTIQSL